jgi:hypothetical protein
VSQISRKVLGSTVSVTVVTDLQVLWLCPSKDLRFLAVGLVGRWWEWLHGGNCCELTLFAVLKCGVNVPCIT